MKPPLLPLAVVAILACASAAFRGRSAGGLFGDTVEEIDWSVGEIMKAIRELGLDERTLVVFTSDNGVASGSSAPWRGTKCTSFEGGVHEPCIMRWPGRIPADEPGHTPGTNHDALLPPLRASWSGT